MADYYKSPVPRTRNLYNPNSTEPFRISRSKIDLFVQCPLCFYLDVRLGVGRPPSFPLTLNIAVDELMKKEFDTHRVAGTRHPFMETYKIDAVPFDHPDMEKWRDAMKRGIEYVDPKTNFSVRGGVDDVWVDPKGELLIVDYKATSKREEITLDGSLGDQYRRQIKVYQWLFRQNGFTVSDTAYFVYVNGDKDAKAFDKKLEFSVVVLPCEGKPDWIPPTLEKMKETLSAEKLPKMADGCDYCIYRKAARDVQTKPKTSPATLRDRE